MMLAVSITTFTFIMSSTFFAMPISGTHTVICAMVGAGLVGTGAKGINWVKVAEIISSWVISPFLALSMTIIVVAIASSTTLNVNISLKARLINLTLLVGCTFAMTNYMVLTLVQAKDSIVPQEYFSLIGSFILGFLVARGLIWQYIMSPRK